MEFLQRTRADENLFNWLVYPRDDGPLLGSIGCKLDGHLVQFGYYYARDTWGRGYATEAARALVHLWLSEPAAWRFQAYCDPENIASAHVLEMSGLTCEGTLRKYMLTPNLSDIPRDVLCYSVVREFMTG
jgi:ribosomal-protein-alanine N-acetyltransferase